MSKRKKKFKKSILAYVIILIILAVVFLGYVLSSLISFEKNDLDNYLNYAVKKVVSNPSEHFTFSNEKSSYESKQNYSKGLKELTNKYEYKKIDDRTFDILTSNKEKIFTIKLDDSKIVHRLGLLTFPEYKIESVENLNNDIFNYDFYILDDYKLFINDNEISENDLIESEVPVEFKEVKDIINLPKVKHYQVKNLSYIPDIKITKDNKNIEYEIKNNVVNAKSFKKVGTLEALNENLKNVADPLNVAEAYSLYLTSDNLTSGKAVWFTDLEKYLVKDTAVYNAAYAWSRSVDRTFTSFHKNDPETFTNEKLSNFVIYNENAFAVDIYLEKNMTLAGNDKRQDVLNERYYFIYYDGEYRVVNKSAIVKEGK